MLVCRKPLAGSQLACHIDFHVISMTSDSCHLVAPLPSPLSLSIYIHIFLSLSVLPLEVAVLQNQRATHRVNVSSNSSSNSSNRSRSLWLLLEAPTLMGCLSSCHKHCSQRGAKVRLSCPRLWQLLNLKRGSQMRYNTAKCKIVSQRYNSFPTPVNTRL